MIGIGGKQRVRGGELVTRMIWGNFFPGNRGLHWKKYEVSPPSDFSNFKSPCIGYCLRALSVVICIPEFQRVSALQTSLEDDLRDWHALHTTERGTSLCTILGT